MLEPVSSAIVARYALARYATRASSAVSPEALEVRRSANAIVESAERSVVLFGAKRTTLSQIFEIAADSATSNLSEGDAVKPETVEIAADFIRALPAALPLPEVAVEPDGSLSLDWLVSRTRVFSLSIGTTNRLAFAWIDGSDRGHGVSRFDGTVIPPRILDGVRQTIGNDSLTFRAA